MASNLWLPIANGEAILKTPQLTAATDYFKDLITNSHRSMLLYAPPKFGVSTVCRHIAAEMRLAASSVVIAAKAEHVEDMRPSEQIDTLWESLIPPNSSIKQYTRTRRDVLLQLIEVEANRLQTRYVIFIIDQSEHVTIRQWHALKLLKEELRHIGNLNTFFLVAGHDALISMPRRRRDAIPPSIANEFMSFPRRLAGVTPEGIGGVLACIDSEAFPAAGGHTYTSHFCPSLWQRGLRISDFTATFAIQFTRILADAGTSQEIGADFVIAAARRFLLAAEPTSTGGKAALTALAVASVDRCGLRESLQLAARLAALTTLPTHRT